MIMEKIKVSILVPIYNVSKFIERCAVSLFEQTFDSIEYIFVDDCSTDNSVSILEKVIKKYPNREPYTKIVRHPKNRGLAVVRNTAVENATGDYILHVDSDDYVDRNMIELLYNKAKEDDADIVVCDYIIEWRVDKKIVHKLYDNNKDKFLEGILKTKFTPYLWNKMIKRTLYIDNGIFSYEGVDFCEDFVVFPRILYYSKKISSVEIPLYHYVQTNTISYTKKYNDKAKKGFVDSRGIITDFFENKSRELKNYVLVGKLKTKFLMLQLADNDADFMYAMNLFSDSDDCKLLKSDLSTKEKIIYYLYRKNIFLLKIFLLIRKHISIIKRFIKSRD